MHVDDKIWPGPGISLPDTSIALEVYVESHALEFLVG